MISPWPQFHTPIGTECIDTPLTSSTGSQPMEWSTSSSSMDRSEVIRAAVALGGLAEGLGGRPASRP